MTDLLTNFKWYRRWIGGTWYYVFFKPIPSLSYWKQELPERTEVKLREEIYG